MLKLLGFSASNYYNVVKLTLLEKGIEFEEVQTWTGADEEFQPEYLDQSPMGKVPCLVTDQGPLSESRCIIDYLEEAYPDPALRPADPFERARAHELCVMIDLYLELPVRRTLPYVLAGKPVSDRLKGEVLPGVQKAARAIARRARFDPYIMGDRFTFADVAAIVHLPVVRSVGKSAFGEDVLAGIPGLDGYLARMEERAHVQRVRADFKVSYPKFVEFLSARYG